MCINVMIEPGNSKQEDPVLYLDNIPREKLDEVESQLPDKFQAKIVSTAHGIGLSFMAEVGWPDATEIFFEIGEILNDSVEVIPLKPL